MVCDSSCCARLTMNVARLPPGQEESSRPWTAGAGDKYVGCGTSYRRTAQRPMHTTGYLAKGVQLAALFTSIGDAKCLNNRV